MQIVNAKLQEMASKWWFILFTCPSITDHSASWQQGAVQCPQTGQPAKLPVQTMPSDFGQGLSHPRQNLQQKLSQWFNLLHMDGLDSDSNLFQTTIMLPCEVLKLYKTDSFYSSKLLVTQSHITWLIFNLNNFSGPFGKNIATWFTLYTSNYHVTQISELCGLLPLLF